MEGFYPEWQGLRTLKHGRARTTDSGTWLGFQAKIILVVKRGDVSKVSLWGPKPALKFKVGADEVYRAAERLILETVQTVVTV